MSSKNHTELIIYSIIQYLQSGHKNPKKENFPSGADELDSIDLSISCLAQAFSLDLDDPQLPKKLGFPKSLPEYLLLGLQRDEKIQQLMSQSQGPQGPEAEVKFLQFLNKLEKVGYFKDCEPMSEDYESRVKNARQKYREKYLSEEKRKKPQQGKSGAAAKPSASNSKQEQRSFFEAYNPNLDVPQGPPTKNPDVAPTWQKSYKEDQRAEDPKVTASPAQIQLADTLKNEGNQLMSQQKFEEAVSKYTRAIELNPKNPILFSNRAAAFIHLKRFAQAVRDAQNSVRLDPKFSRAYGRLGTAYFHLEEYLEAEEAFEKGLELDPENSSYLETLKLVKQKIHEQAKKGPPKEFVDSIPELDPNNPEFEKIFRKGNSYGPQYPKFPNKNTASSPDDREIFEKLKHAEKYGTPEDEFRVPAKDWPKGKQGKEQPKSSKPSSGMPDFSKMGGMGGMPDFSKMGGMGGMPDMSGMGGMPNMGGMGGMPNMGGMGGMPDMSSMMNNPMLQQMFSNPQFMQSMMNNPMVQQMMNDPSAMQEMMNSPMTQQMMNDPSMVQNMMNNPMAQQMMNDPNMMQNMMSMFGGGKKQ